MWTLRKQEVGEFWDAWVTDDTCSMFSYRPGLEGDKLVWREPTEAEALL